MANATSLKGDIVSKEDVQNLVTRFYAKVRNDDQLAHHFATVDWDHHTPVIVKFWSMILHGELGYKGNP
ncbi:MAG TPA: group III truncated hemoglobin, partial [Chryseosolibacter sp.]